MNANGEVCKVLSAQRDLYLRRNDKVLFVLDNAELICAIRDTFLGFNYHIALIDPIERPGQDYTIPSDAANDRTVAWLVTQASASHSPTTRKLMDREMFLISNPGITPDWSAVLDPANREPCERNANAVLNAIGGDVGGTFIVSAKDGTHLIIKTPDDNWEKEIGTRSGIGTNGLYGEVCTAPYSAFGRYVLQPGDFLTNPINEVTEPIALWIAKGKVEGIDGGKQATQLRDTLAQAHNHLAFQLGEFAFGINPGKPKKLLRSVVAEKLVGGIHIAIGTNQLCLKESCPDIGKFRYGRYSAGVHIDCIKFGATVCLKRESQPPKAIVENGVLVA